ncbi:MAG: hypothetical protein HY537_14240 [Deltaproteobacteria bacterium]|nr:hypothetical protein [Deltaproteobacteria bacterium]
MRALILITGLVLGQVALSENFSSGFREGGGGFYVASSDQSFQFSLMGYAQMLGAFYSSDYYDKGIASRVDAPTAFSMRRARLDVMTTLFRDFEFLFEVGTPTLPIAVPADHRNFGLIEARLTTRLVRDYLQLRVGKFVGPFSSENSRSSRALDVIERASVLNTMIATGALDVQMGAMLFGRVWGGIFNWYFGLFNGNGSSSGTPNDNNGHKQIQVKGVIQPIEEFSIGLGYETNSEPEGDLNLYDHAFVPYLSRKISGRRHGYLADVDINYRDWSFRAEGMVFKFKNDAPAAGTASAGWQGLIGAYGQLGYWLTGNDSKGVQAVVRWELARFDNVTEGEPSDLQSVILGLNWHINANIKNQINYIGEIPNGASGTGAYSSSSMKHIFLNELQVKF